jgi:glutamine amidotransferase
MCELFAMSSSYPATVARSLAEFARHAGLNGLHKDGWGIAFYDRYDVQLMRDTIAAGESIYTPFIQHSHLRSKTVLAHIRHATVGKSALHNTQPFVRELGGRRHVFVHNGDLEGLTSMNELTCFQPIGDTDSEHAFCLLLYELQRLWQGSKTHSPPLAERFAVIRQFATELRNKGPANFIYADGDYVFAHGHKRSLTLGGPLNATGLYYRQRECEIKPAHGKQHVLLFASVPLDGDTWQALAEGDILVAKDGDICLV